MTVDLEGFTYMRQDQKGVLVGIYEIEHEHWAMDGAPWNYGMELFKEDLDRIENELTLGFERYPAIQDVGIKTWVNGAFTFSPDGNPLVGPVPGKRGYWSACAVMAGFLQGGGVGKTLAEWMIHGEPEADAWCMDVARYGSWAENKQYIKETTGQFYSRRFVMTYPNEQLPAGRVLKTAPAYGDMTEAGCQWGQSWDLEVPLYFAEKGFEETPSLKRSNAFEIVAKECKAVREGVDITGFSRFEISGPGAEDWLNSLLSTKLPKPGRARLAVMLSPEARLKGDLTLFNWGDGTWWLMGSYYLRAWHMRWFNDHIGDGVTVRDLGEDTAGFSLSGPKSKAVIEKLTDSAVGELPFMGCGVFDIGLLRCKVGRLSVTGEAGYEIHCRMGDHATRARMKALSNTALTRCYRCGLKRASASGRQNSHSSTPRAKPGWTVGSIGKNPISSVGKLPLQNETAKGPSKYWSHSTLMRMMPMPAGMNPSGRTARKLDLSHLALMGTQLANHSQWPW